MKYLSVLDLLKSNYYQQYTNLTIKLRSPKLDANGNVIGEDLVEHTFYAEGDKRINYLQF